MLYQELPKIDSTPLDGWGRWLAPGLITGAAVTAAILLMLVGQLVLATAAVVIGTAAAGIVYLRARPVPIATLPIAAGPDYSVIGSAIGLSGEPVALTDGEGTLLIANPAYRDRFGARPPLEVSADAEGRQGLELAKTMAWRDGAGCVAGIATIAGRTPIEVARIGSNEELLLWRFPNPPPSDPCALAASRLRGRSGDLLGNAGVLAGFV